MKELTLSGLPLPPSDNRLTRHGFNAYASAEYVSWLSIVRPILLEALGADHAPDTDSWWGVTIRLRLNHGDGPNRQKGILDWLTGRYPLEHATTINGKKRSKGALVNGTGLWDDDKRVRYVLPLVEAVRCDEPSCDVTVRQVPPPVDARESAKAAAKAEREQEKAERAYDCLRWTYDTVFINNCGTEFYCRNGQLHGFTAAAVKAALAELAAQGIAERTKAGWRIIKGIIWR